MSVQDVSISHIHVVRLWTDGQSLFLKDISINQKVLNFKFYDLMVFKLFWSTYKFSCPSKKFYFILKLYE